MIRAVGLIVVAASIFGPPAAIGKQTRDNANFIPSCADLVNHKPPGLAKPAWQAEWNKCNTDRKAYRDS
jgi:hypothetical protein